MHIKNAARAVGLAAVNFFRPSYLSSLTHATFAWDWLAAPRSLKAVGLTELVNTPEEIGFLLCPQVHGETPLDDIISLCHLVRARKPQTIFEFGTFRGQTTVSLAMNAPADARIFTLDLPPNTRQGVVGGWDQRIDDQVIGQLIRSSQYGARITQLFSDSRTFDAAPYRSQMDFIFIDGCHEYEFVKNDSEKALEMLSPTGVVAWHDYGPAHPDVPRYLEELSRSRPVQWIRNTQIAFVRNGK